MGCAAGKEKITSRQAKFLKKTIDLCEQFNELKFEVIKSRGLLYQKFNIKNRIKSGSNDSKNSIETQVCGGKQNQSNKDLKKTTPSLHFQSSDDQQTTHDQIQTNISLPNYTQMVNIDEFIIIDASLEWKYLKETYTTYQSEKNTLKVIEMCKFFHNRLDEQILSLEEIYKQSDILYKCIQAFKNEIKKKSAALYNDLNTLVENSKKMIEQLKSSKTNLSSLSLLTLVVDTSASLVNCSSTPIN